MLLALELTPALAVQFLFCISYAWHQFNVYQDKNAKNTLF